MLCHLKFPFASQSTDLVAENVKWMTLEVRAGGDVSHFHFWGVIAPLYIYTGWQTLWQFRNRTFKRFATCWVTRKLLHHMLCFFFPLHSFTFSHRLAALCLTSSHLHISQSFFSFSLSLTLYIALIRIFFSHKTIYNRCCYFFFFLVYRCKGILTQSANRCIQVPRWTSLYPSASYGHIFCCFWMF